MNQNRVDQNLVDQNLVDRTIADLIHLNQNRIEMNENNENNQNLYNENMENQNIQNLYNENMENQNIQNIENQNMENQNRNTVYPIELRWLYQVTHIVPSEENFLYQVNNVPHLYLVLYWLNLERLYPHFVEEEMDLESIALMEEQDFLYFQVQHSVVFIQFVNWLRNRIG
jgi:hypothetical protein